MDLYPFILKTVFLIDGDRGICISNLWCRYCSLHSRTTPVGRYAHIYRDWFRWFI